VLFNFRATGITEPQHLGHFVERFARGIVNRSANELVIRQAANADQHRVSAAHNERHMWFDVVAGTFFNTKKRREQMSFQMVNCQVRFTQADCQSFRN
jgi:hypothetical protein